MWQDEVLEEIYKIREEHAKSFNYDLDAICTVWKISDLWQILMIK